MLQFQRSRPMRLSTWWSRVATALDLLLKPRYTPISRLARPRRRTMAVQPLESRWALSGFGLNNMVYRPSSATAFVDVDHNGTAEHSWVFGVPGDRVIAGDVNQDGLTDLAVYRNGTWFVDISREGAADLFFSFGGALDVPLLADVNNDGATDLILYRPSDGSWLIDNNRDGLLDAASPFGGQAGDLPVVGDFNGDARLDRAIYRPSLGRWYVDFGFSGVLGAEYGFGGASNDLPFAGDYNDDGLTDIGIFRDGILFVSATRSGQVTHTEGFGIAGDRPWPGYYDFRRIVHAPPLNMAVFRPGTATVFTHPNLARGYGVPGDVIVSGDFNGNTITDVAIFRNGGWHIDFNRDSTADQFVVFGQAGDMPLGGDVNNDGAADLIIFRNGLWFISTARNGQADIISGYGQAGDLPAVGDLNADGILDRAIYRQGTWHIDLSFNGTADSFVGFGGAPEDKPFLADFNNDRKADLGIFRNGTWFIDTTRTGRAAIITGYGIAGDVPIPGYYDTSNSIFVRQGASGTGTEASPFNTIQAAVNAAGAGSIIRVASGAYNEQVNVISKTNVTLVGASRHFLNIRPNVGNSMNVTLSSNIYLYDIGFNTQDAANGSGRGIQISGSSVFAWGIRTSGVSRQGIYTAAPQGQLSYVEIHDSHLNESQRSAGFFSEQRTVARLFDTRVDSNGTGSGTPADQFGRGLVFTGNSVATLRNVSGSFNRDHGLIADGDISLYVVGGSFSFNPNANGAIINKQVQFVFDRTLFEQNGTTRGPVTGFNGLEIDVSGTGGGQLLGCTFKNNTAYGVFLGNGRNILIRGNIFQDQIAGLFVNGINQGGDVGGDSTCLVVGNLFTVPGNVNNDQGIVAWGSRAIATVGGAAAADKNTFRNYAQFKCTYRSRHPQEGLGVIVGGDGLSLDDANLYDNSPAPHHFSE